MWPLLKQTFNEFSNDNCLRLSSSLAYYSVFSAAPMIMIAIGVVGWIYGDEASAGQVSKQLGSVVGSQMAKVIEDMVVSAQKNSSGNTLVGLAVLLFGASAVFGELKDALNTIWQVKLKDGLGIMGFVKGRLFTFGMVLVIGLVMLTSLVLTTTLAALNGYIEQTIGVPKIVSNGLGFLLPLAVEIVLFALVFKVLPDVEVEWSDVWAGAIFTAVLFEVGKFGLGFYLGGGGPSSSFGAASSLVLLLLWVYWTSAILFFGAEFTEVHACWRGHQVKPKANAEFLHPPAAPTPPTEGMTLAGVPVQQSVLSGAPSVAAVPEKETLATLQSAPSSDSEDLESVPKNRYEMLLQQAKANPLIELAGAVSVGLLLGAVSRRFRKPIAETVPATEHFRRGAVAAAVTAVSALASLAPWARKRAVPAMKQAAHDAGVQAEVIGRDVRKRVRKAMQ